jgi:conjugal transfer/type IV secretion protein DotA/TraY
LSKGDPVLNLQELGHKLINTNSVLLTGMGGAMIAKSAVDIFPSGRLAGMAASILGADDAMGKLIGMAMALLVPVVLALMFAGICLAYYVPVLPFIIWVSAIVGWLVLTMEMMVAAPIWAAMHAIPEGEGMAGQHGKQGYMMFFGILFRPALHVVGFFMAFAIVNTVGHFIGDTYRAFTSATNGDTAPYGLPAQAISWLATLVIGASLAVVSIHKVFNLITWLPDNILRWAGGNTPSLGHEDKSGGMIVAAMSQTQHKISGGLSKAVDGFSKPSSPTSPASSKSKADMHTLGDVK